MPLPTNDDDTQTHTHTQTSKRETVSTTKKIHFMAYDRGNFIMAQIRGSFLCIQSPHHPMYV